MEEQHVIPQATGAQGLNNTPQTDEKPNVNPGVSLPQTEATAVPTSETETDGPSAKEAIKEASTQVAEAAKVLGHQTVEVAKSVGHQTAETAKSVESKVKEQLEQVGERLKKESKQRRVPLLDQASSIFKNSESAQRCFLLLLLVAVTPWLSHTLSLLIFLATILVLVFEKEDRNFRMAAAQAMVLMAGYYILKLVWQAIFLGRLYWTVYLPGYAVLQLIFLFLAGVYVYGYYKKANWHFAGIHKLAAWFERKIQPMK